MSGIYQIRNLKNGKVYIGSTTRKFWARKREHFNDLKHEKHDNPHLQNSYNKYGREEFEFEVLEKCSVIVLGEREKFHWELVPKNMCYNSKIPGEDRFGGIASNETRRKLSDLAKKNWKRPEYRQKMKDIRSKEVCQVDKRTGATIAKFSSTKVAEKETGVLSTNIAACARGAKYHKTAGGYCWEYAS